MFHRFTLGNPICGKQVVQLNRVAYACRQKSEKTMG